MKSEQQLSYLSLPFAEGMIEAGPAQHERLDELTGRLQDGEFHVLVDGFIPSGCIDGRGTGGGLLPKPDSAGGTESLFVADDLTAKRFAGDGTTQQAYAAMLRFVTDAGYAVGGHTDTHAHGEASGCGANDKLPIIYDFITRQGAVLRELAEALGITASDEAYEHIMANAAGRTEFSSPKTLLDELTVYGDGAVEVLEGDHNEVVAVINTQAGTTLDRVTLRKEFGETYEAFNIDTWTFRPSAQLIAKIPEDVDGIVLALAFYNLATAHVLCGKNMRVIIR